MTEKKINKLKEWAVRIHESLRCEMTIQKWCETNGVSKDAYYYWKKEVEKYMVSTDSPADSLDFPVLNKDSIDSDDEPVFVEFPLPYKSRKPLHQDGYFTLNNCFSETKIIIQHNHFQVFVGEAFNKDALLSVLEVVGRA